MRLIRIGPVGQEVPCLLDAAGQARDVSAHVTDFGPETLATLQGRLAGIDLSGLPWVALDGARIGAPMAQPPNIYCIGLDYSDHAAEAGLPVPAEPILFNKSSATFCGLNDDILFSPKMTKLDWEVELGIVIGKAGLNIALDQAMHHVFGYTVVNDLSERAWQMERGGQWAKGKSFPNFCPAGPWLVSRDEVPDVQNLGMSLDVNGQRRQTGTTARMIFSVAHIVTYLSEFLRLEPGDLICTGTPPGVGAGMKPPQWLTVGDVVDLQIEGLGQQRQTVIAL